MSFSTLTRRLKGKQLRADYIPLTRKLTLPKELALL